MKKIQIITIFLFVIISSFSQENKFEIPNYKNIQKEIQKKESNFYYPKLLERLEANDTLLSKEEYKHLYFGYLFQPKYNAYWTSPDQDKLSKYYSSEKLEEKDYDQMIKLANHSILDFPFDMRNMNFLAYIYHLKGDEISAKKMTI